MIYQLEELVPNIHPTAWVADSAAVIGNVDLHENVSVWFGVVLRGDGGRITIGSGTNIQDNTVMHGGITIGKDCVIAAADLSAAFDTVHHGLLLKKLIRKPFNILCDAAKEANCEPCKTVGDEDLICNLPILTYLVFSNR